MEKPYKCDHEDCSQEFYRRYQLTRHQGKHGHLPKVIPKKINSGDLPDLSEGKKKVLVKRNKKFSQTIDVD